jgi:hypothetical protein
MGMAVVGAIAMVVIVGGGRREIYFATTRPLRDHIDRDAVDEYDILQSAGWVVTSGVTAWI